MVFRIKVRAGFRSSGCLEDGPPTAQGLGWGSIMGTLKVGSPPKAWGLGAGELCPVCVHKLLPSPCPSLPPSAALSRRAGVNSPCTESTYSPTETFSQ